MIFIIALLAIRINGIVTNSEMKCEPNEMVKCVTDTGYKFCFEGETFGRVYDCEPNEVCSSHQTPYCFSNADIRVKREDKKSNGSNYVDYCVDEDKYPFLLPICSTYGRQLAVIPYTGCRLFSICREDGNIIMAKCPEGSLFNGEECSKDYVCPFPCEKVILADEKKNLEFAVQKVMKEGFKRWPIANTSCRNYVELFIDDNLNILTVERTCPINSWFDPVVKLCRIAYYCQECPHTARQCEDKMQDVCNPEFIVPECKDSTYLELVPGTGCHFYVVCNVHPPEIRKCSDGLFNNVTKRCEKKYQCPHPCRLYNEAYPEKNLQKKPECDYKLGIVKNSFCSEYVDCSSPYEPIIKKCRTNLFYDPRLEFCVPNYKCPEYDCVPTPHPDS